MASYLPTITADYSTESLVVRPHDVIQTQGRLLQTTYSPDSGAPYVVTHNDTPFFFVTLQWEKISETDKSTIIDFYFNPLKGKGLARSFLWLHPKEQVNYIAKFKTEISESLFANSRHSVAQQSRAVQC